MRWIWAVLFTLVSFAPIQAQEVSEVRFYILPIEQVGNYRGPEYLPWRFDQNPITELAGVAWGMKDYGAINTAIVAADVTTEQHTLLAAQPNVIAIPANLDEPIGAARLAATKAAIESLMIPADWVLATHTYRQIARYVTGLFLYAQRIDGITGGQSVFGLDANLGTQFKDLPANIRAAMIQAANELGYYTGDITATNTLRVILRKLADEWRGPIYFGIAEL